MLFVVPRWHVHINISLISICLIRHSRTDVDTALQSGAYKDKGSDTQKMVCHGGEWSSSRHSGLRYENVTYAAIFLGVIQSSHVLIEK